MFVLGAEGCEQEMQIFLVQLRSMAVMGVELRFERGSLLMEAIAEYECRVVGV